MGCGDREKVKEVIQYDLTIDSLKIPEAKNE